jgi:AraC-like DNA-binding protein
MENFQKYLPISSDETNWGLYVLNTGVHSIQIKEPYPSKKHPQPHYFNWDNGRVIDEYQIIYISKGSGYFESKSYKKGIIKEGTIIILFPGEWHRFKPDPETGWDEFWVGFQGKIIQRMEKKKLINRAYPILEIGFNDQIINLFINIMEKTKIEKMGYQFYISGIVMHLLGLLQYETKQMNLTNNYTENIINKSQIIFRKMVNKNFKIEDIVTELNVSYAWFRKAFKNYTGLAPKQYLLQLRIEQAKIMLQDNSKPIKEIAYELNFESTSFFSKQFKLKTGKSPVMYRNNQKNKPI